MHPFFAFVAARAVVDVDLDLGLVRVVQLAAVQDVGRAVNPAGLEGQIEGGLVTGLGHAVMEEVHLENGIMQNASFTDYLIPTTLDVPPIASDFVERAEPGVPYGAKGAGEVPAIAAVAAVVNALRAATRRRPAGPDAAAIGASMPATSIGAASQASGSPTAPGWTAWGTDAAVHAPHAGGISVPGDR